MKVPSFVALMVGFVGRKDVGRIHHGRDLEAELVLGVEAVTGFGAEQNLGVGLGGGGFEFQPNTGLLEESVEYLD